jgi:hypothetical protein
MLGKPSDVTFCDECCYDDNPHEELRCKKVKCCYLVRNECILIDGVVMLKENIP